MYLYNLVYSPYQLIRKEVNIISNKPEELIINELYKRYYAGKLGGFNLTFSKKVNDISDLDKDLKYCDDNFNIISYEDLLVSLLAGVPL